MPMNERFPEVCVRGYLWNVPGPLTELVFLVYLFCCVFCVFQEWMGVGLWLCFGLVVCACDAGGCLSRGFGVLRRREFLLFWELSLSECSHFVLVDFV